MKLLLKIIGRWRLLFGNCPACNSDAPAMYDCNICDWNKKYNYQFGGRTKAQDRKFWWNRFKGYLDREFNNKNKIK